MNDLIFIENKTAVVAKFKKTKQDALCLQPIGQRCLRDIPLMIDYTADVLVTLDTDPHASIAHWALS